jgi:hypothetical protein
MNHAEPFPSLPDMFDEMPAPGEPVTDRRPYLREEAPNEFVIQGVGYLPVMDRIWETFFLAGFGDRGQEDYPAWRDRFLSRAGADSFTPEMVAGMTHSDCRYLLRAIQRAERFCDGAWAEAHAQGLFHALARRLMELAGGDKRKAGP